MGIRKIDAGLYVSEPERRTPPDADPNICGDCWHEHPEGEPCPPVGGRRPLGERLGFQPIQSRTHGYNGQEHR